LREKGGQGMKNYLTLYDCDELIKLVEDQAEKNEGELSESDWQLLVDAQTKSMEKLQGLMYYISKMNRDIDNAEYEMDRIKKYRETIKNRLDSIKRYLLPYVQEKGKITVGTHTLSIRKSKGVVLAEGFCNPMYCNTRTEIVPDKPKIKESIESGIEVAGAVLENRINLVIK
jgi:hypothetical protein